MKILLTVSVALVASTPILAQQSQAPDAREMGGGRLPTKLVNNFKRDWERIQAAAAAPSCRRVPMSPTSGSTGRSTIFGEATARSWRSGSRCTASSG